MKSPFLVLAAFLSAASPAGACTTFSIPAGGQALVAKSFEWDQSLGMAVHNKRGVQKTAILFSAGTPLTWQSRFASLTFSQHGREFPLSGMNERGLVVEIMILSGSEHPAGGEEPGVNELQWIQYILDTSADTTEAIRQARGARVVPLQQKVHYLACDARGDCAAFEYLKGRLEVRSGAGLPVPALANNSYDDSLRHIRKFEGFGGSEPVPAGGDSLSRFVRAADLARSVPPGAEPVAYSFRALQRVSAHSQWHLVWEPAAQKVHFRTANARAVKTIDISRLGTDCQEPVQLLDMEGSLASGEVTSRMNPYTTDRARVITEKNASFDPRLRELALAYPEAGTRCLGLSPR